MIIYFSKLSILMIETNHNINMELVPLTFTIKPVSDKVFENIYLNTADNTYTHELFTIVKNRSKGKAIEVLNNYLKQHDENKQQSKLP